MTRAQKLLARASATQLRLPPSDEVQKHEEMMDSLGLLLHRDMAALMEEGEPFVFDIREWIVGLR